jgi:AcrR family transcriptional regulator
MTAALLRRRMRRKVGRPKANSDEELKQRILEAASEEFAVAGYRGASFQRIAEAAGCNRALIYFYYGGKPQLFTAVLAAVAGSREQQMEAQPATLAEGLIYWFKQNFADPQRIRLVMQEALAPPQLPVDDSKRREYLGEQLSVVKAFQQHGLLNRDLDPRHLLTAFLALTSFPAAFPNVASAALGANDDDEMVAEWSAALRTIAQILSPVESEAETG